MVLTTSVPLEPDIQSWLQQKELTPAQRQHSLQTLALISGPKFDREHKKDRVKNAIEWLGRHLR